MKKQRPKSKAQLLTTTKELTTNQNAWRLIVFCLNFQTWRQPVQAFNSKNSSSTVSQSNHKKRAVTARCLQPDPACNAWKNDVLMRMQYQKKWCEYAMHSILEVQLSL